MAIEINVAAICLPSTILTVKVDLKISNLIRAPHRHPSQKSTRGGAEKQMGYLMLKQTRKEFQPTAKRSPKRSTNDPSTENDRLNFSAAQLSNATGVQPLKEPDSESDENDCVETDSRASMDDAQIDTSDDESSDTEPASLAHPALSQPDILQSVYEKVPDLAAIHRLRQVNNAWRAASVASLKRWFVENASNLALDFGYWSPFAGIDSVVEDSGAVTVSFGFDLRSYLEKTVSHGLRPAGWDLAESGMLTTQKAYEDIFDGYLPQKESNRHDALASAIQREEVAINGHKVDLEEKHSSLLIGREEARQNDKEERAEQFAKYPNPRSWMHLKSTASSRKMSTIDQRCRSINRQLEALETHRQSLAEISKVLHQIPKPLRPTLPLSPSDRKTLQQTRSQLNRLSETLHNQKVGIPNPEPVLGSIPAALARHITQLDQTIRVQTHRLFPTKLITNHLAVGDQEWRGKSFTFRIGTTSTTTKARFSLPLPDVEIDPLDDECRIVSTTHRTVATRKTPALEFEADWLVTPNMISCVFMHVRCSVGQWLSFLNGKEPREH
ncbi:hypothetical protein HK097_004202 [Rhizophlyctis rosea]|uniref:Uncharacterized protein n=1 Tax=Rhizophlyctis rosea TaxID=64517 RepID=A0AAD5S383_9FUNG|nr:hypothetical protein HK097_004202 [Rhizophlyctis rosea]